MFKKIVLGACLCLLSTNAFAADSVGAPLGGVSAYVAPAPKQPVQGEPCNWGGWRQAVASAKVNGGFVCNAYSNTFKSYCSGGIITQSRAIRICSSSHLPPAPSGTVSCNWGGWKLATGFYYTGNNDCHCDRTTSTFTMYCSGGKLRQAQAVVVCVQKSCGHAR